MKKHLFITLLVISSSLVYSQVGINTPNPLGSFHVDGGKDNPLTGLPSAMQSANDMVVDAYGKVGIGTVIPTAQLEINGNNSTGLIKIVDGNQGVGKVLTSDTDGLATWKDSVTDTTGSLIKKIKYEGAAADANKTVVIDNLEFRLRNNIPEARFTSSISTNTVITYHLGQFYQGNGYEYGNFTRTFNPANWSVWQNVAAASSDGLSNTERNQVWLSVDNSNNIYCIEFVILSKGSGRNIYTIIVTRY